MSAESEPGKGLGRYRHEGRRDVARRGTLRPRKVSDLCSVEGNRDRDLCPFR